MIQLTMFPDQIDKKAIATHLKNKQLLNDQLKEYCQYLGKYWQYWSTSDRQEQVEVLERMRQNREILQIARSRLNIEDFAKAKELINGTVW